MRMFFRVALTMKGHSPDRLLNGAEVPNGRAGWCCYLNCNIGASIIRNTRGLSGIISQDPMLPRTQLAIVFFVGPFAPLC
jgi:hypothetical protein